MRTIYYCPAPTGAGKTYAIEERLAEHVRCGETVILTQPSKNLCHQTAQEMSVRFPDVPVKVFNQDTCGQKTVVGLSEHLRNPPDRPHLIIATWAAFMMLPHIIRPERYHLICDEIPTAFVPDSIRLPDNHSLLTDALEIGDAGPIYGLVKVSNPTAVRKMAENRNKDAFNSLVNPLAKRIHQGRHSTYIDIKSYNGLLIGSKDDRLLATYSMLDPTLFLGFKSVVFAGARAEETILYKWFEGKGVRFVRDTALMNKLRYSEHENGHLIEFYYASERNWSKTEQKNDPTFRPRFIEAVQSLFGRNEFVWQDNVTNEVDTFSGVVSGYNVGHSPHGLNAFQHINRSVILSALNYSRSEGGFLTNFCGIGPDEQRIALAYHSSYQTYNRISVRDPNNYEKKIVILPDRQNAAWQRERFPGSVVIPLGIDSRNGPRTRSDKLYANPTDRKRAQRNKLEEQQKEIMNGLVEAARSKQEKYIIDDCHGYSFNTIKCVTSLQGSIIAHKRDSDSLMLVCDKDTFISQMKRFSVNTFDSKESNMLISPGLFIDKDDGSSCRSKPNAFCGRNVYLDIEKGTLTHRQLSKIFPNIEMIAYSSYSHTKDMPRYRVVFLTDSIMSSGMYTAIYNMICHRIELAGYKSEFESGFHPKEKVHGIDRKPYLTDLFYLPCQPADSDGFFLHYRKLRKPLDVLDWCYNSFPTRFDDGESVSHGHHPLQQIIDKDHSQLCEEALQRFRDQTVDQGRSHKALRALNFTLLEGGVDDVSRDVTLTQAAYLSRSREDRLRDKQRMMRFGQRAPSHR
ncbi:DEAD/DEAH box helicase family protein [Methylorubrum extorquens]|uniref:DEAD/DEAH box helicase family protein n=1 Tax=Methylorubrum extorquens TaxID=408 RepID=UPI001EE5EFE8|nr:DEAD/DEAH box helicase family protein [Methylorubrum extorquens]MCG5247325.1 DEAD/DEAH box helicase family protein [Methylorubrum extorquens]